MYCVDDDDDDDDEDEDEDEDDYGGMGRRGGEGRGEGRERMGRGGRREVEGRKGDGVGGGGGRGHVIVYCVIDFHSRGKRIIIFQKGYTYDVISWLNNFAFHGGGNCLGSCPCVGGWGNSYGDCYLTCASSDLSAACPFPLCVRPRLLVRFACIYLPDGNAYYCSDSLPMSSLRIKMIDFMADARAHGSDIIVTRIIEMDPCTFKRIVRNKQF